MANSINLISPTPTSKEDLLQSLITLDKEQERLLQVLKITQQALDKVAKDKSTVNIRLEQMAAAEQQMQQNLIPSVLPEKEVKRASEISKIIECGNSVLKVNKNKIMKSQDGSGEVEHYAISLISKEGEIDIDQFPINVKNYGEIKEVLITDGQNEKLLLKDSSSFTQGPFNRLVKYLSTDLKVLRKEINPSDIDINGNPFDCQRFSHFLQHGKDGNYNAWRNVNILPTEDFRTSYRHVPNGFYLTTAQTQNYGKNGTYSANDTKVHHFMCLDKDLYVSKYGEGDVFFASYQQMLKAYFPDNFTKGFCEPQYESARKG